MTDKAQETSERHTAILEGMKKPGGHLSEFVQKIGMGDVELLDWKWGEARLRYALESKFDIGDGTMFGGYVAALADNILAVVSMTVLRRSEQRFRTANLQTSFFRPLKGAHMIAEARVVSQSQTLLNVETDMLNEDGKLAARATAVQALRLVRES